MIDTKTPLPNGFGTGELYTSPLTIYRGQDSWYYIFDHKRYLCRCDHNDDLEELLIYQQQYPSKDFPYSAREFLFPETFTKRFEDQKRINETIDKSLPPKPTSTKLSLKDLEL